jgi:ABC-type nickel/cobalt efflux system permease component RcnA
MFGLDEHVAELGGGGGVLILLVVAALLGLRHATDPDHLAAVSALIAGDGADDRRAGLLGLAWGAGHGTTITIFGIPIVLLDAYLPEPVQIGTEMLIGLLIMILSVRLLVRWRRGRFHAHDHRHGTRRHTHLHPHAQTREETHDHGHAKPLRTTRGSFGVGLLHGIGGSAGIGVLLLAAIPDHAIGISALLLFAAFTGVSMGVASWLFGRILAGRDTRRRFGIAAPALGVVNLAFGAWYALGAVGAVPYVF